MRNERLQPDMNETAKEQSMPLKNLELGQRQVTRGQNAQMQKDPIRGGSHSSPKLLRLKFKEKPDFLIAKCSTAKSASHTCRT